MTAPRQVLRDRDLMFTRRVAQRELLLRPDAQANAIYTYCLAEAAQRFGITLYGWLVMSNHVHIVGRDNRGNFPEFLEHLNKMSAKALNRLRGRRENFWSSEQANVVHLVESQDTYDKLIYTLANPVASHLVEHASDWPGASSLQQNLSGRAITVERPRGFFRDSGPMPETVTLRAERLPEFEHLSQEEWREKILASLRAEEAKARDERARKGLRVLGRKAVLRADPTTRPPNTAARGGLRPHVACRDPARRAQELRCLRGFRVAHRSARASWCSGDRDAVFPLGTYLMLRFGVRCVPPGDAPVTTAPS